MSRCVAGGGLSAVGAVVRRAAGQRLGYDQALLAEVAGALARAVMHDMRWKVLERHGLGSVEPLHAGVFMVVQRFRGDLGLFVHLHALARSRPSTRGCRACACRSFNRDRRAVPHGRSLGR